MTSLVGDRDTHKQLLGVLGRVLAPLVRLLISKGITYQMASELLKRVYVQSALCHFEGEDTATGTRLSLLTGLNRKEIRRLTTDAAEEKRPETITSFASATHAVWCSVRRWRDRDGKPKPLSRHPAGREASFDDLVRSITVDVRPGAIYEELVRLGYAHEDGEGYLHLNARAFVSQRDFNDRLLPLGENLEDHAQAAVINVLSDQPLFLDQAVFSDELSEQSVSMLAQLARDQWQHVHEETVKRAIEAEAADAEAGRERNQRIRLGMYFYAEKKEEK